MCIGTATLGIQRESGLLACFVYPVAHRTRTFVNKDTCLKRCKRLVAMAALAVARKETNKWRMGIFDCCSDVPMCLAVCFCGPITTGQVFSLAFGGSRWMCVVVAVLLFILMYSSTFVGFERVVVRLSDPTSTGLAVAGLVVFLVVFFSRTVIRDRRNIDGNACETCCISAFCSPCATCQLMAESNIGFNKGKRQWNPFLAFGAKGDYSEYVAPTQLETV